MKPFAFWILCFLPFSLQAWQDESYQPLKGYDFSSGDYTLLFTASRGDSAFLIDRPEQLFRLQHTWQFDQEAVTYPFACNDGWEVLLIEGKWVIQSFSIRLRCQAFVADESWHMSGFHPQLVDGVISLHSRDTLFTTLEQARITLNELRDNKDVVWVEPPAWESFDGFFHFNVPNPNHDGKSPTTAWGEVEEEVRQKLTDAFPETPYSLKLDRYGYGRNYPILGFRLMAHKELFDAFDLYPKSSWGWRLFPLTLTYYQR